MSTRLNARSTSLLVLLVAGLGLSACATSPSPVATTAFSTEAFAWSTQAGRNAIEGSINYVEDGARFDCVGNVGLIPDTGFTRARMERLYGSTRQAVVPAAVVRARNDGEQAADYRAFERANACEANRFRFTDLPDGSWFLISPVRADDKIMVLMKQVQTRGGRTVAVSLGN